MLPPPMQSIEAGGFSFEEGLNEEKSFYWIYRNTCFYGCGGLQYIDYFNT